MYNYLRRKIISIIIVFFFGGIVFSNGETYLLPTSDETDPLLYDNSGLDISWYNPNSLRGIAIPDYSNVNNTVIPQKNTSILFTIRRS